MTHVLLWDIDGTLLTTARAGVFALEEAAREVCGATPDFSALKTSGLTDSEVAELAIRTLDVVPEPALVSDFLRVYERHLPDRLHLRRGRVLTRVTEVLEDLRRRPDVHSLLLTGNTRAGAAAKLAHYGLDGHFEDGAFCADGDDRPAIARKAWELALTAAGGDVDPDRVFVIGDTPHDVRAGDAIGARTVAVATGVHPLEELQACEPWLALQELPEPARFAALLGLP
jgi:phosphoglycolate phosphatase